MKTTPPSAPRCDRLSTWEEVCLAAIACPERLVELPHIHGLAFENPDAGAGSEALTAEDLELLLRLGEERKQFLH
jgi:hypothetical protein